MAERQNPDGQGGPHAFVADLEAPILSDADQHHLKRVLRLRNGDPLTLSDGQGRWCNAHFGESLEVVGPIHQARKSLPPVAVGFAPVKGDRPEWVVQKLTEIGVDTILVLRCDRSVVRWEGDRETKALDRLRSVAREAAMQSRRCWLPAIEGVLPVLDVMGRPNVARAQRGGGEPTQRPSLIIIGPEGGWSEREEQALSVTIDLGDHVLRTETAALVAGVYLTSMRR